MPKQRIDAILVDCGLAESRARAQALLMAGHVLVNNKPITKPGAMFPSDVEVRLRGVLPYVGRGGFKLAHALDTFGIDPSQISTADIGASTGGFTDCLLQRGAKRVYAIDVGRGQIDQRLRNNPGVVVLEEVNARFPLQLPELVDLVTIDVSFISATLIIPNASAILRPGGILIVLVKPQFEAHPEEVGKGGIIRDPLVHARVLARFICWAVDNHYRICALTTSPITGASGNNEFFVMLKASTATPHFPRLT